MSILFPLVRPPNGKPLLITILLTRNSLAVVQSFVNILFLPLLVGFLGLSAYVYSIKTAPRENSKATPVENLATAPVDNLETTPAPVATKTGIATVDEIKNATKEELEIGSFYVHLEFFQFYYAIVNKLDPALGQKALTSDFTRRCMTRLQEFFTQGSRERLEDAALSLRTEIDFAKVRDQSVGLCIELLEKEKSIFTPEEVATIKSVAFMSAAQLAEHLRDPEVRATLKSVNPTNRFLSNRYSTILSIRKTPGGP